MKNFKVFDKTFERKYKLAPVLCSLALTTALIPSVGYAKDFNEAINDYNENMPSSVITQNDNYFKLFVDYDSQSIDGFISGLNAKLNPFYDDVPRFNVVKITTKNKYETITILRDDFENLIDSNASRISIDENNPYEFSTHALQEKYDIAISTGVFEDKILRVSNWCIISFATLLYFMINHNYYKAKYAYKKKIKKCKHAK